MTVTEHQANLGSFNLISSSPACSVAYLSRLVSATQNPESMMAFQNINILHCVFLRRVKAKAKKILKYKESSLKR